MLNLPSELENRSLCCEVPKNRSSNALRILLFNGFWSAFPSITASLGFLFSDLSTLLEIFMLEDKTTAEDIESIFLLSDGLTPNDTVLRVCERACESREFVDFAINPLPRGPWGLAHVQ